MNQIIRKLPQATLLFFLSWTVPTTVLGQTTYPQGHLLIGFTKQSGNDLVYDLGLASSLTDGKTWNLGTLLTANFTLSTVSWGVIGDTNGTSPKSAWSTTGGSQANTIANVTQWSALNSCANTLYQFFALPGGTGESVQVDSSQQYSWNQETINGALPSAYLNAYENPNVVGLTNAYLWYGTVGNTPSLVGKFALNSSGIVTFSFISSALPPPPRIVKITRSSSTSTIYFTTTNGSFTYTLYYTNSTGLAKSGTNWPASLTTVTGNGLTNSLSDVTTSTNRLYRIGVH